MRIKLISAFTLGILANLASGLSIASGDDQADDSYNKGKDVLHTKLMCTSCLFPRESNSLDKTLALTILAKLDKAGEGNNPLSESDKKAVAVYLAKRFDIK